MRHHNTDSEGQITMSHQSVIITLKLSAQSPYCYSIFSYNDYANKISVLSCNSVGIRATSLCTADKDSQAG